LFKINKCNNIALSQCMLKRIPRLLSQGNTH
jgi:hypothetical protein